MSVDPCQPGRPGWKRQLRSGCCAGVRRRHSCRRRRGPVLWTQIVFGFVLCNPSTHCGSSLPAPNFGMHEAPARFKPRWESKEVERASASEEQGASRRHCISRQRMECGYPRKPIDEPSLRWVLTLVQRCITTFISVLCWIQPRKATFVPSLRLVFTVVQRRMMVFMFIPPIPDWRTIRGNRCSMHRA
jgi:hypothetical protein